MESCIFCDIIEGKRACYKIYEDNNKIVILDRYPIDKGHSLIITRKPYEKLTDMSHEEVSELFAIIPKIANGMFT